MNDIEDRLRADGEAWQHLVDGGDRATTRPAPSAARLRWIAPALSAAAVVAIGVTVAVVWRSDGHMNPPIGAQPLRTHIFDRLTVRYPVTWHAVAPSFTSGGVVQPLGYVVSQDPIAQCRPNAAGKVFCGPPVSQLAQGASAIVVTGEPAVDTFRATTEIDGWPARLRIGKGSCVPGASYVSSAQLLVSRYESIEVTACTASTDPADHRVIDHILKTLRYIDRSAVTISGRFLQVGGPSPGLPRPLSGVVTMRRRSDRTDLVLSVGRTGRYTAKVQPGSYTISGRTSPVHGGYAHCSAPSNPVVARHSVTGADVICPIP